MIWKAENLDDRNGAKRRGHHAGGRVVNDQLKVTLIPLLEYAPVKRRSDPCFTCFPHVRAKR